MYLNYILISFITHIQSHSCSFKAQLLSKEEIEKVKAMHATCIKETSVDPALVTKAMQGEYVDDPKLKDHIFCVNNKLGFVNDAGDIVDDVLIKKLTDKFKAEKMVTATVKQCSQKKATPSETAFELVKCLHSMAPKDLDITSIFKA